MESGHLFIRTRRQSVTRKSAEQKTKDFAEKHFVTNFQNRLHLCLHGWRFFSLRYTATCNFGLRFFCYMKLACVARPVCSLETKLFQKNFYIAEEGNDMNRYEFILVDGSKIAVYADSRTEAAKKVREMLNS